MVTNITQADLSSTFLNNNPSKAGDLKLATNDTHAKNAENAFYNTDPFFDVDYISRASSNNTIDRGAYEMGTSFNSGGAIPNPPTDISLSSNSIDENSSGQTHVGSLSTTDSDGGSHTYSLVSGSGSTDNSLFEINGTNIRTKSSTTLNYESRTYSVRIRTTDPVESNLTFGKQFTISSMT